MKKKKFLFLFMMFGLTSYGQQKKQPLDYQYFRDPANYYEFELYADLKDTSNDKLILNFSSKTKFNKIEKVFIKVNEAETKLKFKPTDEIIKSDNSALTNYQISFSIRDIEEIKECNAAIIFKLDNGLTYSLPFLSCMYKEKLAKP